MTGINEHQFNNCWKKFDHDQDGFINFQDLMKSIGEEMFPTEGLYFRQDTKMNCKILACSHPNCFVASKMTKKYCHLHQKLHEDSSITIFKKIHQEADEKWSKLVK